MTEGEGQRALQEVASVRAELSLLRELMGRLADRLDAYLTDARARVMHDEDERRSSRRFVVGTIASASAIVLTAVGLFIAALT